MARRDVIRIDEAKCDGCGLCVSACAEGAIQVIDGKAKLVSEVYCDGLGACLGHCPQGAITIETQEAAAFDEEAVRRHLASLGGPPAPHPPASPESPMPARAVAAPTAAPMAAPHATALEARPAVPVVSHGLHGGGCPGSRPMSFAAPAAAAATGGAPTAAPASELRQWPVQLHLVSPQAPYFQGADVLLAADCTAFALGDFHQTWLAGRALAIACPKLDVEQQVYLDKLVALIDHAGITSLTVLVMQVPCCSGLLRMAQMACARASRQVALRSVVVSIQGEILRDTSAA